MKTAGIIAEYNPFHSGHKYQIDTLKRESYAIIAVMSGHFVQRGDTAITDKWTRARTAVSCGCDLVLELPARYSLSAAADFAYGAVSLLNGLSIVDTLCFGAECGDTEALVNAAHMLSDEPPEISKRVRALISSGISYPSAYAEAWADKLNVKFLTKPNNLLAIEYIKALKNLNSTIEPRAILRVGAEHDGSPSDDIASASHIRDLIRQGKDYRKYVPDVAYEIYRAADMTYDISLLDSFITGTLRTISTGSLADYAPEGLENRVKAAATDNYGFETICAAAKSKRYTLSRVRRTIISAVLGLPTKRTAPDYARVLAMNDTGRELLKLIRERSCMDIITKTAAYNKSSAFFAADLHATDIFSMCSAIPEHRAGGRDYTTSPAVILQ